MPFITTMWEKIKTKFKSSLKNGASLKGSSTLTSATSKKPIIKLMMAFLLSNIFFFMLFSEDKEKKSPTERVGIEIIIEGKLMTSFEKNKEVILSHQHAGIIKARLLEIQPMQDSYLVLTTEAEAIKILARPVNWSILPYLKNYSMKTPSKPMQEIDHEIHF